MAENEANWERQLITNIANNYMKENRRKRRWNIFLRVIFLLLCIASLLIFYSSFVMDESARNKPHTAVIDVEGAIFSKSRAGADEIAESLSEAYKDKGTKGIILRINSPGGSPVQASFVFNEVKRLRIVHPSIPVYAVCTDMCASAAYYIAASADQIFADPSSLVGSIGVIYNGFGFVDTMQKLGVERRLLTAGSNKGFMDPFSPVEDSQKHLLESMLEDIHKEFIDKVKLGRGARLKNDPTLFSGLFWTGRQAKKLGLIDDFKSPGQVAREIIKYEKIIDYSDSGNVFEKFAKRFGSEAGTKLGAVLGLNQPLR